jgi:hypothetical protein
LNHQRIFKPSALEVADGKMPLSIISLDSLIDEQANNNHIAFVVGFSIEA